MTNKKDLMPKEDASTTKITYAIYILYLASFVIPILPILAVILAYIFENDAKTYLKSHYQYLIRSFWLGLLYFFIAGFSIIVAIGIILMPLCVIWWIIRIVKGLKSLIHEEAISNPKTWLF